MAELLRQRSSARELEPGSWIDELKLADEFGISRTPLREALKVLAAEGLVTMKVRRGAYVTEVSRDDLARGLPPAGLLESDAAGVVAAQRQRRRSSTSCRRCTTSWRSRCASATRFFATNEQFHMRLLEIADNRWRDQMVADLRKVMKLNRHHSLFKQGRLADSLAEHRALMPAIEARDAAKATRLMRAHFESGLEAAA